MNTLNKALLAGVALLVSVGSANAAVSSYTQAFGPTLTDFTSGTFTIPAFTGGTLTSVTATLTASENANGTLTNNSASAQRFTLSEPSQVFLNTSNAALGGLQVNLTSGPQTYALAPGASAAFGPYNPSGNSAGTFTAASDLASFTTANTYSFGTLTGETVTGGGGNISTRLTTTASGTLTIQYTFTPAVSVPEPASMALLGAGLAGVGLIRRRKA